jgi:S-formylglutathione hydrolase FrmB
MGCESAESSQTAMITAAPACNDPGTIHDGKIEESIRGYAYYFQVYLPSCYEVETERRYPALYLLPGQGGGARGWFTAWLSDLAEEMAGILDEAGYEAATMFTEGGHNYSYWVSNMPAYWRWLQEDWR